jgi:sugar/nucleoside kinase (ribokinase family)
MNGKRDFFQSILLTLLASQIPMEQAIRQANEAVAAWEKH